MPSTMIPTKISRRSMRRLVSDAAEISLPLTDTASFVPRRSSARSITTRERSQREPL